MLVKLVDRLGQGSRVSHECPTEKKYDLSRPARHRAAFFPQAIFTLSGVFFTEVLPALSGEEFPRPRPNLPLKLPQLGRGSRSQPKPPKPFGGDWREGLILGNHAP
jgi:hypothetical protein